MQNQLLNQNLVDLPFPLSEQLLQEVWEVANAEITQQVEVSDGKLIHDFTFRGDNLSFIDDDSHEAILAGPSETGKTVAALVKASRLLESTPNVQGLIIRKVRREMRVNVLRTFETKVLKENPRNPSSPIEAFGGRNPQEYIYPNGSSLYVAGLDDPGKALGSEWDFIYVNQPEELTLEDWETLLTRCTGRAGNLPNPQMFGDPNPALDKHWILQRAADGPLRLFKSRHEDNPLLYDAAAQIWTEQGEATRRILSQLTGSRRLRLYEGLWGQMEGIVYPEFDRHTHIVSFHQMVEWGVLKNERENELPVFTDAIRRVVVGVDWGYTHPGVMVVGGLDGDGRLFVVASIYRTNEIIDWWAQRAFELQRQFRVQKFVADPSEPGHIETMKRSKPPDGGRHLRVSKADNSIAPGIAAVKSRLRIAGDGRPRLYILEGHLLHKDAMLERKKQIWDGVNEFDAYQMDSDKDQPIKENDHLMDALRYLVMEADRRAAVGYSRGG